MLILGDCNTGTMTNSMACLTMNGSDTSGSEDACPYSYAPVVSNLSAPLPGIVSAPLPGVVSAPLPGVVNIPSNSLPSSTALVPYVPPHVSLIPQSCSIPPYPIIPDHHNSQNSDTDLILDGANDDYHNYLTEQEVIENPAVHYTGGAVPRESVLPGNEINVNHSNLSYTENLYNISLNNYYPRADVSMKSVVMSSAEQSPSYFKNESHRIVEENYRYEYPGSIPMMPLNIPDKCEEPVRPVECCNNDAVAIPSPDFYLDHRGHCQEYSMEGYEAETDSSLLGTVSGVAYVLRDLVQD